MAVCTVREANPQEVGMFEKLEQNQYWINSNFKKLVEEYEGKFIAVRNKEVVASGKSMKELEKKLEKKNLISEAGISIFRASWDIFRMIL